MAQYKSLTYLAQSNHTNFDTVHCPGAKPADSGIYRCVGCGLEISHNANNSRPPQNHHEHSTAQGTIRWQMIVCAQTQG
jgi:hypothetical protein